jgi:tetratricopeptide (TPR) repeat protein
MSLQQKLETYIDAPHVPENSYAIGYEYELMGQTASAMGFYLKCAELTDDKMLAYECLLRKAICFRKQGQRETHVKNTCYMAISVLPQRPEAYHLISIAHEMCGEWHASYGWACAGETMHYDGKPLQTPCGYPGYYGLPFQRAVAAWWVGKFDEARKLFDDLADMDLNLAYQGHVKWNRDNLSGAHKQETKKVPITDKAAIIAKIMEKRKKDDTGNA